LDLQGNKTRLAIDKASPKFPESNLMHQMNGYVFCNGPTLQLQRGQTVRWLVMGFGSEVDMHTPVFDGQAVQYAGTQQAVVTMVSSIFCTGCAFCVPSLMFTLWAYVASPDNRMPHAQGQQCISCPQPVLVALSS
jgi:hypothetical protein